MFLLPIAEEFTNGFYHSMLTGDKERGCETTKLAHKGNPDAIAYLDITSLANCGDIKVNKAVRIFRFNMCGNAAKIDTFFRAFLLAQPSHAITCRHLVVSLQMRNFKYLTDANAERTFA